MVLRGLRRGTLGRLNWTDKTAGILAALTEQ